MPDIRDRLYISTIAADAAPLAERYGLGLEIAEYCTATNLASEEWHAVVREKMRHTDRLVVHAPFNELAPTAIEPLVRDVTRIRHGQAFVMARSLGAKGMVVHAGFVPNTYYPPWFIEQSAEYWQAYLENKPEDCLICLENVMEPEPEMLAAVAEKVNDRRFRLCLDIGHANSMVSDVPLKTWVAVSAPYLAHLHLHSNEGSTDLHLNLGEGNIPMADVLGDIVSRCPSATLSIETAETSAASVQWLIQNGFMGDAIWKND